MSNPPLQAVVIGAGHIAKQHLAALAATPHAEAVGVCDLSPIMAESTADRFGIARWSTDSLALIEELKPACVHITTPPASHYQLAKACLQAGCHVMIEKPATLQFDQLLELQELASEQNLRLVEDHNYLFNHNIQEMLNLLTSGALGELRHVEVQIHLDLFAPGSRFSDPDLPHPSMQEPAGMVADFLTHLCYLAYAFVGEDRQYRAFFNRRTDLLDAPISEFQALVDAEQGTALLSLSGTSQPDAFLVSVQGTKMQATTNLFEVGVVSTRLIGGPKPLMPIRNMLQRGRSERRNARHSLWRKLGGGPGPYEGLWELVARMYSALQTGSAPPISSAQVTAVNRLVHALEEEVATPCEC